MTEDVILQKVKSWLSGNFDEETKKQVQYLIENDTKELTDAFYRDLEFGTGGLRGIMGVGTNRMNKYTVAMATQGLANYLLKIYPNEKPIKVAIAFDSRNNSKYFAQITADVLSANGIKVYLFNELRPTPVLSFTVRHLKCQSGIVITASHNPKEYNGYKVYGNDGGQLVSPHDKNVITEVQKIKGIDDVKINPVKDNIVFIGEEIDKVYLSKVKELSLNPAIIKANSNLKIVYTPIHGSGVRLVPLALKEFGFTNIISVDEQNIIDGNFPSVKSPNPEEPATLELALQKAKETNADILFGTDPDCDRVGVAIKNNSGEFILLNGNQTATLLIYYLLNAWKENKMLTGKEYIVKTIVTSELLKDIAISFDVESFDVLTGFKYIAEIIKKNEGKKQFIGGGEESYGYLVGDFVRDKDAVISCCMIAEAAAYAAGKGKTMYQLLIDIYTRYGFYKESLLSLTRKGKEGAEEIKKMMIDYRNNPIPPVNGVDVVLIKDYLNQKEKDLESGIEKPIDLPKSDVLQFFLRDGSKITIRPSGTEPKIKFYFGLKCDLKNSSEFDIVYNSMDKKIKEIIDSMNLK
ncbi:MAG: phospho-sugar mutase [Bacteroidetes bacterium]|nr:phospho-sugar mutase [Bacteroidota bacterium]